MKFIMRRGFIEELLEVCLISLEALEIATPSRPLNPLTRAKSARYFQDEMILNF